MHGRSWERFEDFVLLTLIAMVIAYAVWNAWAR